MSPIKLDLEKINLEFRATSDLELTQVEVQLEKLNLSYKKLDLKFKDRAKKLDLALFKTTKFEDTIKTLNASLHSVETKLDGLSKTKFNFKNLTEIEQQTSISNDLIKHLLQTSNEIDEFKELCERIIQNCDDLQESDLIEKKMENLIQKWNLLTRQLDEKKTNLNFLNIHLNQLNTTYLNAFQFVNELNTKFTSNLILNCIDPIVIKCQYDKMKDLNDSIMQHSYLITDLQLDAYNLTSIDQDYENSLNSNNNEQDELNDSQDSDKLDNKYLSYLPKSVSLSALHSLVSMLDKTDIEDQINQIDLRFKDYKFLLTKNLSLMHRIHPLCENFSCSISEVTKSVSKQDSDLDWLEASSDNETSQKDKENLLNEIKKNLHENENLVLNLQGPVSSRLIDELKPANIKCDEFISNLNENINAVKSKLKNASDKLNSCFESLESRRERSKELYGEIDDLLEWLDESDTKLSNLDGISHDSEVIKVQLTDQVSLNDEINKQKLKLKHLVDLTKNLIRGKLIDDSIELKEKLNGLHLLSTNLIKRGSMRLNELEQAYAISKNFTDSYNSITIWFDEINSQLDEVEKQHKETKRNLSVESKELIKHELNLLKQIERNLQEKKSNSKQ